MSDKSIDSQMEDYSSSDSEEDQESVAIKQQELVGNIKSILKNTNADFEDKKKNKGAKLVRKEVKLIGKMLNLIKYSC